MKPATPCDSVVQHKEAFWDFLLVLCRQEKVTHVHCYHRLLYLSHQIQPSQTGSKLKYYINIILFFSLQKYNAVFRVMTVMVSDVQLIRIRWYYPSLLFSQSHKFKNDWRFWSHPVSVFSQSCKSKNDWDSDLTHSKPWYNQSKKNIFLVLWKLFGLLEILMPQNTMLLLYISRWTGWLCYGRMKQILSNSQLAMPIWHPLYHRKYSVGNLQ